MTGGRVPISQLPAATSTGVNDLLASSQADDVTRKITIGQLINLVPLSVAFLDLTDTPGAYNGQNDKLVKVNGSATGLEFTDGGAIVTADNGLVENPAGNVQLGDVLTRDTTVGAAASGFDLTLSAELATLTADTLASVESPAADAQVSAPAGQAILTGNDGIVKGTNSIDMNCTAGNIQVTAGSAGGSVLVDADTVIDLQSQGNVSLNADGGSAIVNALVDANVTTGNDINLAASTGELDIDAVDVDIDATNDITADSPGNIEVTAGNNLDLEGQSRVRLTLPGPIPNVGDVPTAINANGDVNWNTGSGLSSADNGLTENPAGNVQLGGPLLADTQVGATLDGFDFTVEADDIQLAADATVDIVGAGNVSLASAGNPLDLAGASLTATATGQMSLGTTAGDIAILPGNAAAPDIGDILIAKGALGNVQWAPNAQFAQWFLPFNSIADANFPLVGEISNVASGLGGDFATTTTMRYTHCSIVVNAITSGGDIVVTGDSINSTTGVVATGDTETITVDTTVGQRYQTDKEWLTITDVDVTTGAITGINYDIDRLDYIFDVISGAGNLQISVLGWRIQFTTNNNNADLGLQMFIINDAGSKKLAVDTVEDIEWTSTVGNGVITDNLRTAAANRDYTWSVTSIGSGNVFSYTMFDFETFFTGGENVIGAGTNDGLQVIFTGPGGGLNNIDHGTFSLAYRLEPV